MSLFVRFAAAAAVALVASAASAQVPVPFPTVDFLLEGRILTAQAGPAQGMGTTMRHKDGKLRMDVENMGMKGFMLFARDGKTATVVMEPSPGMKMAMEIDLAQATAGATNAGPIDIWNMKGMRVGTDRIMGESCDWWQAEQNGHKSKVCATPDGIPLKAVDPQTNQTVWEGVRLERRTQDPALFVVPADAQRMQMPNMPGMPRRQ